MSMFESTDSVWLAGSKAADPRTDPLVSVQQIQFSAVALFEARLVYVRKVFLVRNFLEDTLVNSVTEVISNSSITLHVV